MSFFLPEIEMAFCSYKNKFEVSKIYLTACMCIYKFCKTKEYLFMIFFCFIQNLECFIIFILIKIHVLLHSKKYNQDFSRFFMFIQDLEWHSCFIIDFHEIFKIFQDYLCFIKDFEWFLIYRGSPTYTKITNTVFTNTFFGLCTCKWGN